jgi:hypothetical protein
MSTATSTIAIAALIVGFGGAASALGSHRTEATSPSPVVQQAANGSGMCAIAATFSADPAMANQIRSAAGCVQAR